MKPEIQMIELNSDFQNKIFSEIIKKYTSKRCVKLFKKSQSMFYHYKNCRVKTLPLKIVNKIIKNLTIPNIILKSNTKRTFSLLAENKKILDKGRKFRFNQLKQFRKDIPQLNQIIESNTLNFEKWFIKYQKLMNFGCRQIKQMKVRKNKIILTYTNFANSKKKLFKTTFPKKILLDEDFTYFFGLWVGDKAGGGRLGVLNKQEEINDFTAYYLRRLNQKIERILYTHEAETQSINQKFDKIIKVSGLKKGYAISVHSINGILKSFFDYLALHLDEFLEIIDKHIFFAGLFDAEGNIFHEAHLIRWSCKNVNNLIIFKKHLNELGLFDRYDGSNLVSKNIDYFAQNISPYLKNRQKINDFNLMYFGKGILNNRFINILRQIQDNPNITHRGLAKALKRKQTFLQSRFLEDLGCISRTGYPKMLKITKKGSDVIAEGARI